LTAAAGAFFFIFFLGFRDEKESVVYLVELLVVICHYWRFLVGLLLPAP